MTGTGLIEFASGLASAAKLLKTLKDLVTTPDARAQVSELYEVIISAQAGALEMQAKERSMLEQISALKEKLASMQAWDTEKQRYKLAAPFTGAMVYALQRAMSDGEPPHYLCASCYKAGKPSILQLANDGLHWAFFRCPLCKSGARTGYRGGVSAKYAEDIKGPE